MPSTPSISTRHVANCAVIMHLIRSRTPSVTDNPEKTFHLLWSSWHVTDDHRTWGGNWWEWRECISLTKPTLVTRKPQWRENRHYWRRKENHSMKLANNSSGYETSKTDRWEPIKSPIIGEEALLRKALNIPTASNQNHIYKALILSAEGTQRLTL